MLSQRATLEVSKRMHIFDRSGMAALSDLQSKEWEDIYRLLENEQSQFLAAEDRFRSAEYKWPRDPLHTWSRVWEYPYAYYHLQKWRNGKGTATPLGVVDLGSGVTFFPFSVARLGYRVTCVDIDPVVNVDLSKAARTIDHRPGHVDCRLCGNSSLPLLDGEVDAVYCVSVLEHISNFETTIEEVFRILKPRGMLILTIDMDMSGYVDIGINRYRDLRKCLFEHFDLKEPEVTVHPLDALQPRKGLFPYRTYSTWQVSWFHLKSRIRTALGFKPLDYYQLPNLDLAVWGAILEKAT